MSRLDRMFCRSGRLIDFYICDLGLIACGVITMKVRPADFGFETIEELRNFFEHEDDKTIGAFATRIADYIERPAFSGDRRRAACVMLCFLSDVCDGDAPVGKMQLLVNRYFRLLCDDFPAID